MKSTFLLPKHRYPPSQIPKGGRCRFSTMQPVLQAVLQFVLYYNILSPEIHCLNLLPYLKRRSSVVSWHSYWEERLSNSFAFNYWEYDTWCTLKHKKHQMIWFSHQLNYYAKKPAVKEKLFIPEAIWCLAKCAEVKEMEATSVQHRRQQLQRNEESSSMG